MHITDKINKSRLQYITPETDSHTCILLVERVCKAGVNWVQLRIKNKTLKEVEDIAHKIRKICNQYNSTFIINDYVEIVKKTQADGVHLGIHDMPPVEARKILGDQFIIGGTANTFDNIQELAGYGVDYIGLGPYRFTATKENLSPILGLKGYKNIMSDCRKHDIKVPIIAIGGIIDEDVEKLFKTGISGIAVSSAINKAVSPEKAINQMVLKVEKVKHI